MTTTTTTIALHANVKVLASTYSAIALTLGIEEALSGSHITMDWDDIEGIKAVIDGRVASLADHPAPVREDFVSEHDYLTMKDNIEILHLATTEEMRRPLKLAPLHDMMDEYFARVTENEGVIEVVARGRIEDMGADHFAYTKTVIENA